MPCLAYLFFEQLFPGVMCHSQKFVGKRDEGLDSGLAICLALDAFERSAGGHAPVSRNVAIPEYWLSHSLSGGTFAMPQLAQLQSGNSSAFLTEQ
jgi:hypothetical protein